LGRMLTATTPTIDLLRMSGSRQIGLCRAGTSPWAGPRPRRRSPQPRHRRRRGRRAPGSRPEGFLKAQGRSSWQRKKAAGINHEAVKRFCVSDGGVGCRGRKAFDGRLSQVLISETRGKPWPRPSAAVAGRGGAGGDPWGRWGPGASADTRWLRRKRKRRATNGRARGGVPEICEARDNQGAYKFSVFDIRRGGEDPFF